ncbi:TetR family transcriptional regulator [Streptomyces sp. NBC_01637]|uniref:TetR family transcriptional regulator n=2 Tax=unclassified Streptomyces TaxID=2593676 RepID=UPI00386AF3D6|nr:TetR family transcriptional regulator [Streptomyces sp. NBC_01653]WTD91763.1 TetR family transcriptional regulator [Streptomyces sp. NBC_01637]
MADPTTTSSTPGAGPSGSLRERTRAAMRAEVSDVAFRLFTERGFENTTVEQIAAAAGLSRTTFFRYFGTKEELVLGRVSEFGRQVADALASRPAEEQPWDALRRAFDVIAEPQTGEPGPPMDMIRLLSDACALMTRHWEKTQGWQSMLAPEISRRLGGPDPAIDMRANALAAAAISCLDAATDAWTAGGGTTPMPDLVDQAMGILRESGDVPG